MYEINYKFTGLLGLYSEVFDTTSHISRTCAGLRSLIPPKLPGVYVVKSTISKGRVLYIGSSGKINKEMSMSGSSIRQRMFGASTPYQFDSVSNSFCFGPTTSGVPPAGYRHAVPVATITVTCLDVRCPMAPSVLEHLLIQGHINEFGNLPDANQKI